MTIDPDNKLGMNVSVRSIGLPGMVGWYEENDTRIECGYTIPEWMELTAMQRATEIAYRRIKNMIEYVRSQKEEEYTRRQSRKR